MEVDYGPVIASLRHRLELVNRVITSAEDLLEGLEGRKQEATVTPPAAGPDDYTLAQRMVKHAPFGGFGVRLYPDTCSLCGLPMKDPVHELASTDNKESPDSRRRETEEN